MLLKKLKDAVLPFLQLRKTTWDIEIYRGPSPLAMRNMDKAANPVLTATSVTDVIAEFIADPFIIRADGTWYMFFETLVRDSNKGVICLATSADCLSWTYQRVLIEESFHLSYPYVFEWEQSYYMIPESAEDRSVRLYKATNFPTAWAFQCKLLEGIHRDPSIFRHGGMWWMFTETSPDRRGTLRLYSAEELTGPWLEHPQSPVVDGNPHITRPGGRVIENNGHLYRITQDTFPDYGIQLFAFEIVELTPTTYREEQAGDGAILKGKKDGFLADRIHHMDACQLTDGQWIAAIDHSHRSLHLRVKT
jgi:hypothetical protein